MISAKLQHVGTGSRGRRAGHHAPQLGMQLAMRGACARGKNRDEAVHLPTQLRAGAPGGDLAGRRRPHGLGVGGASTRVRVAAREHDGHLLGREHPGKARVVLVLHTERVGHHRAAPVQDMRERRIGVDRFGEVPLAGFRLDRLDVEQLVGLFARRWDDVVALVLQFGGQRQQRAHGRQETVALSPGARERTTRPTPCAKNSGVR